MLNELYPRRRLENSRRGGRWDRDWSCFEDVPRARNSAAARNRLSLEWLEPRRMLSGTLNPIASVQPYNGEQLSQSPQEVVVTFNGLNVPALMGSLDVQIEELNRDGTKTPLWNFGDAPPELSDATGTELIIPLQKFDLGDFAYDNVTLPLGQYEIDLAGGTSISYAASGANGPGPQLWNPNEDHEIGTFSIVGKGATLNSATPLGVIGPAGQTVWGSLNPNDPGSALDLYQFTLAKGQLWQVGLAVSAFSVGSKLLPDLSLFDSNGTLLATSSSGAGLPSDPNDPYLFAGLQPGTYYIGISGSGNLPYSPGGYDPVLGVPGINGIDQDGGPFPFALSLIAAPHEQATRLVNFSLNYGATDSASPTGFTLTFTGPIDVSNLFIPDAQETALEVVDSSGNAWPITPENYFVSGSSLTVIFDRPLPVGNYALVSSPGSGLVDLAGQPVTAAGGSSNVLATWTLSPQTVPHSGNDLGVLWPLSSNDLGTSPLGSFQETTDLAPTQGSSYRFTVIVPGYYNLTTQLEAGQVAVAITGNGVTTILDSKSEHQLNNYLMNLNDGVYTLRFENVGQQSVAINWLLKVQELDWEKIVNNGVGQNFALSLSLFSAVPADSAIGGDSSAAASVNNIPAFAAAGSGGIFAGSMGPIPNSLLVTSNTGLIGQPTLMNQSVAAVGPTVEAGSTAVANSGNGFDPGITYWSTLDVSEWLGNEAQLAELKKAGQQPAPADAAVAAASVDGLVRPEADSSGADLRALGQAEWLMRLGARVQGWLGAATGALNSRPEESVPRSADLLVQNTPDSRREGAKTDNRSRRTSSAAQADLGTTACAIVVGVAVYRLRRPLIKWWRQNGRMLATKNEKPARPLHRGPHAVLARARATTRIHKPKALR
jgi:hypothetical protein